MSPRALVTAGGTREPIDDVRAIANASTGRLGVELALALAARGMHVALLASREAARLPGLDHPLIAVTPFESFIDLARALEATCATQPELILMAAAVADYSPVPLAGKRSSDAPTWTLELTRNPKLLDRLRGWCPRARIVGFKLVSGMERAARVDVATRQCRRAALDFTVVNDTRELAEHRHPVDLVDAGGTATRLEGSRGEVARALVSALLVAAPAVSTEHGIDAAVRRHRPELRELRTIPGTIALDAAGACEGESAQEVLLALARAAREGHRGRGSFALGTSAGAMLGLIDPDRFDASWAAVRHEALACVAAMTPEHALGTFAPIVEGAQPVGVVVGFEAGVAPYIAGEARGRGLGDRALRALEARGAVLAAPAASGLAEYFLARGHLASATVGSITTYSDPRARPDVIRAASVCLYEPCGQRVLVGRRTTAQWRDHWAFPGGVLEPGETELEAALRELREETGVDGALPYPVSSATVYAARDAAGPVYRITNFLCYTPSTTAPITTPEMDAAWIAVGEVSRLRPMAAGTRRVWSIYGLDRASSPAIRRDL